MGQKIKKGFLKIKKNGGHVNRWSYIAKVVLKEICQKSWTLEPCWGVGAGQI
ncbi:MAG: hypothetical protein CM15mV53_620 [uncultured marine virus]|nr:MAG: hypothetical protein CM15mV53_620 [uncultured marine virus]